MKPIYRIVGWRRVPTARLRDDSYGWALVLEETPRIAMKKTSGRRKAIR